MTKYIDAEALKQAIYERLGSGKCNYGFIARVIDSQIAADVEPVRYGKWIGDIYPCCSVCGETSDYYCDGTHKRSKRCPNCGAKMDIE